MSSSFQSPSVTLEKGAYRIRAPHRPMSPTSTRSRKLAPDPSTRDRLLAVLIVLLATATLASFATAYYLLTTRWRTASLALDDRRREADLRLDFIEAHAYDTPEWRLDELRRDATAKFVGYLPHSGFHNQRIALENALILSRLMNRTLLMPPVRLSNRPIRYAPFDELRVYVERSTERDPTDGDEDDEDEDDAYGSTNRFSMGMTRTVTVESTAFADLSLH